MKLEKGQKMINFKYNTPYKSGIDYLESRKGKKSILLFLRYYGCTVCQLDLKELQDNMERFKEKHIDLKVVLQSDPEKMKVNLDKNPVDFEIICDPLGGLYKKFNIGIAKSKLVLGGGSTVMRVMKAKKAGLEHGEYEGEEMQLPATFILNEEDELIYVHYGKNAADTPGVEDLLKIVE